MEFIKYIKNIFNNQADRVVELRCLWITDTQIIQKYHGNAVYIDFLTKELSQICHLDLLYYIESNEKIENLEKNLNQFSDINIIKKRTKDRVLDGGLKNNFNIISYELMDWIKSNVTVDRYDFVICDYIYMAPIFSLIPDQIIKVINTHDLYGDRHVDLDWNSKTKSMNFCITTEDENKHLENASAVITITDDDKNNLSKRIKDNNLDIPVSTIKYLPKKIISYKKTTSSKKLKVGFVGSSNPINREGINQFIEYLSISKIKDFELILCGLICNFVNDDFPWLTKLNEVSDDGLEDFYNSIDVLVNPMPKYTTGLKIKTLECLISDIPIIGTYDAFSGIKTTSRWHKADNINELVSLVNELSKNKNLLNEILLEGQVIKKDFIKSSGNEINDFIKVVMRLKENYRKKNSHLDYSVRYLEQIASLDSKLSDYYDEMLGIREKLEESRSYIDKIKTRIQPNYSGFIRINKCVGLYPDNWCNNLLSIEFNTLKNINEIEIEINNPRDISGHLEIELNNTIHRYDVHGSLNRIKIDCNLEESKSYFLIFKSNLDSSIEGDIRNISYILRSISFKD